MCVAGLAMAALPSSPSRTFPLPLLTLLLPWCLRKRQRKNRRIYDIPSAQAPGVSGCMPLLRAGSGYQRTSLCLGSKPLADRASSSAAHSDWSLTLWLAPMQTLSASLASCGHLLRCVSFSICLSPEHSVRGHSVPTADARLPVPVPWRGCRWGGRGWCPLPLSAVQAPLYCRA